MFVKIFDADDPNFVKEDYAQEERGYRMAAMSNAGLPRGKVRVTWLPKSCFTDQPAPKPEDKNEQS
jgi:hypothetical protein